MSSLAKHPEVAQLIRLALQEDHVQEDITTRALVPAAARGEGLVRAKAAGVAAGLVLLGEGSALCESFPGLEFQARLRDGDPLMPGDVLALVRGPAGQLLPLERVLLNLLQRLCGIATLTARFVAATQDSATVILETRKTCPGWRLLDKYAVRLGGGQNHRQHLADQVLIKENHLIFLGQGRRSPEAIARAVGLARAAQSEDCRVIVEVETMAEFRAALDTRADVIMLDEFARSDVLSALALRNERGQRPLLEISGGITEEQVAAWAATGVDRISVGALTHSAPALDLALDVHPLEAGD